MTYELFLGLMLFAFVSSVTPGPNNMMLMASGANFGFQRTIPHMLGVGLGFGLMIFLVGLGLIGVFDLWPVSHTILKVLSVVYMLWLAWKIAHAAAPEKADASGRPFSFLQAAAFQWVNPKAWSMALTSIAIYAPDRGLLSILLVSAVFVLINIPSVSLWTLMGRELRRILTSPRKLRAFNWVMAGLLVVSLYPVLL